MRVIFYSDRCEYSKKMLAYLDKYNLKSLFNLVNIDVTNVPPEIDIVPAILDTELNQPLKGKDAFEYLVNIKYFNNPTNNIEYIKDLPPNPAIPEDDKANAVETINLKLNSNTISNDNTFNDLFKENESAQFYKKYKEMEVQKATTLMTNERNIQDKKLATLLRMKKK